MTLTLQINYFDLQAYLGHENIRVCWSSMCIMGYYRPLIKLNVFHPFGPSQFSIANNLFDKVNHRSCLHIYLAGDTSVS